MLPRDRVRAALERREPDCVPIGEFGVDYPITERALGRSTLYRAKWREYTALWEGRRDEVVESYKRDLVDIARVFEWDFVPVMLMPPKKAHYERPTFLDEYTWRDESGRVWKFSPMSEGWAICVEYPEVTIEDLDDTWSEIDESQLEVVRHVVRELGDTHYIIARGADGSFPHEATCGLAEFLVRMITDPSFVHRAVDLATQWAIKVNDILLDEGCDAIWAPADYCDSRGPMMSPAHFREFMYPSIRAMCDAVHARDSYLIKHTDGNTWSVMNMMIEAGIDGWQGIQPRIGMDMKRLKELYGDQLTFFGGVDCDTLVAGTPDDVVEEVRYATRHAGPGGGLVLCSGNTLMVGTKWENYQAMLQARRQYGTYPISVQRNSM
jgi:hypothetical protein